MVKVTRHRLIEIWNTLYKIKELEDKALSFYIVRNLAFIEDEIKSITTLQNSVKPTAEFNEFEGKRILLAKSMAKKDSEGNPVIINNVFIFNDNAEWLEKFNALTTEYKDVIVEHDKVINEYNQLMNEEIEVEFKKIPFKLLPDNINYNAVKDIIKETEEEVESLILESYNISPVKERVSDNSYEDLPLSSFPAM